MIRLLLAVVCIWAVVSCISKNVSLTVPGSGSEIAEGTPTNFSYTDIYGHTGSIDQFRKNYIVLHFWATWCPPCVEEMPRILQEAAFTPSAIFLLVSVDKSNSTVQRFIDRMPMRPGNNVVMIFDPNGAITSGVFKVHSFPTNYILAPDGTFRQHRVGVADWTDTRNNIRVP